MRDSSHDGFDGSAAIFAEHAKTLRGYVRYHVSQHTLQTLVLKSKKCNVLDIGAGSGIDAAWLSCLGHSVTLLEPSAEQQLYAQRRFNFFLTSEQRERITLIQGELDLAGTQKTYDLVLVHGAAAYQEDPIRFIKSALERVAKGGYISLLEKGYYGAESRAIREHKFKEQQSLAADQHVTDNLGLRSYAFKPEEILRVLESCGFEVITWNGVRVITDEDNVLVSDLEEEELQAIVAAEIEHGADPGIRAQGQLLHFIARKPKA